MLLCWLITSAFPVPEAAGGLASGDDSASTQERLATPPAPLDEPRLEQTSTVPASASFADNTLQPRGEVSRLHFANSSPVMEMSHSPSASTESTPDGLPASAMHCTFDGGVMTCGACRMDSDCPAGKGCVANRETRRMECLSSDCEEDAHCFPGFTCRAANTGETGPIIRRCTPEGVRSEGERCDSGYISRNGACREGLRCVREVCTRPCRLEDPTGCPAGHTCTEGMDGPGCVVDCRQLGCPQGQQCKLIKDSRYQCLESVEGTCPETPCAEGERCVHWVSRGRGTFWCARSCNSIFPDSCPSGYVCGRATRTTSACFRACDPNNVDSCEDGWLCGTVSEDMSLWGCGLNPHR